MNMNETMEVLPNQVIETDQLEQEEFINDRCETCEQFNGLACQMGLCNNYPEGE